jgi:protease YdgD
MTKLSHDQWSGITILNNQDAQFGREVFRLKLEHLQIPAGWLGRFGLKSFHKYRDQSRRLVPGFMLILAALFIAGVSMPTAASAELEVIDSLDYPWSSIGRVNYAGYRTTSMCTGTLIAPKIVLTAAHCLYDMRTLKPLPEDQLLFIAGVRREQHSARLETACVLTGNEFVPLKHPKLRDIHKDVGLIILKEASSLTPVPTLTLREAGILSKETRFQAVGYRRSRRFLPTTVSSCKVLGTREDTWITDCPTESGASGGPLLVNTPEGLRVAGITSAKLDDQRSAVVPFLEWLDLEAAAKCGPGSAFFSNSPAVENQADNTD